MKVGIVGAGLAGLAAARTLADSGMQAIVWEKRPNPGGRVETIQEAGFVFDSGATSIAPRGLEIEHVMLRELDQGDLVRVESPIYTHQGLRVMPGDVAKNRTPRYTYRSGNALLPEMLASTLDIRYGSPVETIARSGQDFIVNDEAVGALILTPPIPISSMILLSLRESRPTANASFRSCLSVLLGFEIELPETNYHALLDVEQRHPLTWLSLESVKSPGRAPEGCSALCAQLSPSYSLIHFPHQDELIIEDTLRYIQRLYGLEFSQPKVAKVRRWKYSLPDSVASFDTVNKPGMRVLLAGDGLLAGRSEAAYESGVRAARLLLIR